MEVLEVSSQKIRIRLKGYDHEVVDQSAKLIVDTAQKTGARVSGPIPLPTERNLYTVIRSPHKDKDSTRSCVSTFPLASTSRSSSKH